MGGDGRGRAADGAVNGRRIQTNGKTDFGNGGGG